MRLTIIMGKCSTFQPFCKRAKGLTAKEKEEKGCIFRTPSKAQKLAKLISVRNFSQEDFLSFLHCGSQSWLSSISIFALFYRKWLLSQENYDEFGGAEAHAAGFYNKEITLLLVLQSKTKDNDTELRNDTLRKLMEKLYLFCLFIPLPASKGRTKKWPWKKPPNDFLGNWRCHWDTDNVTPMRAWVALFYLQQYIQQLLQTLFF